MGGLEEHLLYICVQNIITMRITLAVFVCSLLMMVAANANTCRDFLVDSCQYPMGNRSNVQVLNGLSMEECQHHCDFQDPDCTFFNLDKISHICRLYNGSEDQYESKCNTRTGPAYPSLDKKDVECSHSADPCVTFRDGMCAYLGDLVSVLNAVESEEICQRACQ